MQTIKINTNYTYIFDDYGLISLSDIKIPVNINVCTIKKIIIKSISDILFDIPFFIVSCKNKKFNIGDNNVYSINDMISGETDKKIYLPSHLLSIIMESEYDFEFELDFINYPPPQNYNNSGSILTQKINTYCNIKYNKMHDKILQMTKSDILCASAVSSIYFATESPLIMVQLHLNSRLNIHYTAEMIELYDFLKYKEWTHHHYDALHYSLCNILPNELINHIESFLISNCRHVYHIPIGVTDSMQSTINFSRIDDVKFIIKTLYNSPDDNNVNVFFKGFNLLRSNNDLAIVVYTI